MADSIAPPPGPPPGLAPAPGSRINVKIVKHPTNAAAVKTLQRLFSKDPVIAVEHKRLSKVRRKNFRTKTRGGRPYPLALVKQYPVKGAVGEQGALTATHDVVTDLRSVSRFIEVTPA